MADAKMYRILIDAIHVILCFSVFGDFFLGGLKKLKDTLLLYGIGKKKIPPRNPKPFHYLKNEAVFLI